MKSLFFGQNVTGFILQPETIQFSYYGGSYNFNIYSDSSWEINIIGDVWITLNKNSGSGNDIITATANKNLDPFKLYGEIKVTSGGITKSIQISQLPAM